MTGQQLKNSILQMAVQGKLVPQDPNDEPARFLLERIRKEKERLVREKIIKPEKNPSVIFRGADNLPYEKRGKEVHCIADEVPFEIPDSWEWARLGSVTYNHGQKIPDSQFCYIDIGSIDNVHQRLNAKETVLQATEAPSRARRIIVKGDVLYSTVRPYLHNMCIVDKDFTYPPIASTGFAVFTCHTDYSNAFLFYYLLSPDFDRYANDTENSKGVAYPAINDERLSNALVPIPPLQEQQRIVAMIEQVVPFVEHYGIKEKELNELNASLPAILKKSILQEAIQGKLVPQDPNDEPASVLLERIRKEKARLVKEGKLKPGKHESVIFRRDNSHYEKLDGKERCIDDEIPFEIPENWEWVRLNSLCFSIADGDHQPPPQVATGVPFLVISNVSTGHLDFKNVRHVPQQYFNELAASRKPKKGDLLFTVTGSFGIVIPIEDDTDFCFQRHMALLKMPKYLASIWLAKWLQSPMVLEKCKEEATGTAQKTVGLNTLRSLILPVPPLAEQGRILRQLSTLMYMLTNQ